MVRTKRGKLVAGLGAIYAAGDIGKVLEEDELDAGAKGGVFEALNVGQRSLVDVLAHRYQPATKVHERVIRTPTFDHRSGVPKLPSIRAPEEARELAGELEDVVDGESREDFF